MGIDFVVGAKKRTSRRTCPKSKNPYLNILHSAYATVKRHTDSKFNEIVTQRISLSRTNRPPMSLSNLSRLMADKDGHTAVVVATVTNDERFDQIPKMTVAALRFTATARARIERAGGRCMTMDELLVEKPTGTGCILLQGKRSHRKVAKSFGAAGRPGHVKPKGTHKVNNRRGARGRHSW